VIVLAATNRADVLDEALLRPGRFDRRVVVSPPDRAGRAAILRIHTRGVTLAPDVDLDAIAQMTPGVVGADLRNLVNEAALLAARRNHDAVTMDDFTAALEKIQLGTERRIVLTTDERRRIAYHESGHALLGLLVPGSDPVRRVSIVPRGRSLGATVQSPVDDRQNYPEDYLRARITSALGGRAMSAQLGPVNLSDSDGQVAFAGVRPYSEATAQLIDSEVRRILEECMQQACSLLSAHRPQLDALVAALLAKETLGEAEILHITGLPPQPQPAPAAEAAREVTGVLPT
jgi:cell division protease FtsH